MYACRTKQLVSIETTIYWCRCSLVSFCIKYLLIDSTGIHLQTDCTWGWYQTLCSLGYEHPPIRCWYVEGLGIPPCRTLMFCVTGCHSNVLGVVSVCSCHEIPTEAIMCGIAWDVWVDFLCMRQAVDGDLLNLRV